MERIKHYTLRTLTTVSAIVLLLSVSIMLAINSGLLDRLAKDHIIDLFEKKFYGRLELQELHLTFPNNVTLVKPKIYSINKKSPSLAARTFSLKVNILSLLQPNFRTLYLQKITADSLNTNIIAQSDGKTNLETIFKRRGPDSTRTLLDHFFCKSLQINNSSINYSKTTNDTDNSPLSIRGLNVELSEFTFKKKFIKGTLENIRFSIPQQNFSLRKGSGQFLFSENRSEVLTLKAESSKSHAELSATFDHFNIFSPQQQKDLFLSTSFLNIPILALDSDELRIFVPELDIPSGLYTVTGNARGKQDNIEIIDLLATHLKSRIAIKGKLLNLQNRDAFAFDLKCDSSKIVSPFVELFLNDNAHKEIARKIGDITFLGSAKGTLNAIKAEVTTLSTTGEASISGEASREGSGVFKSKGKFRLKEFKPHLFMNTNSNKSLINASGNFDIQGGNNQVNQVKLDMKLADSFWQNQTVKEGTVLLSYINKVLYSTLNFTNNQTNFNINTEIDLKQESPRYRASGKMAKLNISNLFNTSEFITDLNGVFTIQGSGFDPHQLNFGGGIEFSSSAINGFLLGEHSKASIEIIHTSSASRASFKSDFLDILVDGNYSFQELIDLGKLVNSGISREINSQNIWHNSVTPPVNTDNSINKPYTINYYITVKDISPLALILPTKGVSLQGKAEGRAMYKMGKCSITSSIDLANLNYRSNFLLKKLSLDIGAECNNNGILQAAISGKAASMIIAGKKAGHPVFSGLYTPSHLEGSLDLAIPDPAQSISAKFTATKNIYGYELAFKHLFLKDASGVWQTADNSRIMIGKRSANFNRFSINKGIQQAMLDGELSNAQSANFQCNLSNIDLNELKRFALNPSLDRLSGRVNASLIISDNSGSKSSLLNINGQRIRYDKFAIGTLRVNGIHRNNQLIFDLHSNLPILEKNTAKALSSINTIEGEGTIPFEISYYPIQFHTLEQKPINVSFRSDNLSAQFIEYLFPIFASVEGVIPTTLHIEGKMPMPEISMTTRLKNTKFKVEPTQVSYLLNGEAHLTPKSIELRDITINDHLKGNGVISGEVRLEKLKPRELFLSARVNQLLLFDKKDRQDETSFGTVTGTTNNISVYGNVSAPVIEGELRIDAADFFLYRSGANQSAKYVGLDKFIGFTPRYKSANSPESETEIIATKSTEFYHSLIDIVQIQKLKVSSIEPLKYTMIFDSNRGELLETSINNLSMVVNKNKQQYRLFGSVNIIGGKYKFSNSNFDLQDGGEITWNNVDIRSGVMNNLYGSKYVHASNPQNSDRDKVNMLLSITGTLNNPQVAMGYFLNEQTQPYASVNMIGGYTSQIDPNAELNVISMLLSKQWYARPGTNGQNSNIAISSAGFSAGTGILSSRISKVVQDIGGLESFNVNVGVDNSGALSGLDLYLALNVPGTEGKVRFIGTGSSPTIGGATTFSDYYGTAQKIEYRITPKVYLEASRSFGQNGTAISSLNTSASANSSLQKPEDTWGISISYKERFQTWGEFWKRIIPFTDKKK